MKMSVAPTPGLRPEDRPIQLKKILLPVDFSEEGKPAIQYAKFLARLSGAQICLLFVKERIYPAVNVYPTGGFSVNPLTSEEIEEHATRRLGAIQMEQLDTIKTNFAIRSGAPSKEITDAAAEMDADVIVMATHGYTGFRHLVLGSTTEQVVRQAHCPVMVVRSTPTGKTNSKSPRKRAV